NVVKYNEAYEYVSFKGYTSGTVIPTNDAEYIRFSTNSNNMAGLQLEKGNVVTPFEPFRHSLRNVEIAKNDIDPKLTREVEEATKTLTNIMKYPKNLVKTKTMYDGYSIDVNGDLQQSASYTTTDLYRLKGWNLMFLTKLSQWQCMIQIKNTNETEVCPLTLQL